MSEINPREILKSSTLIADKREVEAAVEFLGEVVNAHYGDREIILLIVMTGAVMPAAWLAAKLKMPVKMDFVHATCYAGQT